MGWFEDRIAELAVEETARGDRPWYSFLARGEEPPTISSEAPPRPQDALSPSGREIRQAASTMRTGAVSGDLTALGRTCPWRGKSNCPNGHSRCWANIGPYLNGRETDNLACARCMRRNLMIGRKR
jgi:hypothetical protein